jgi:hypothetical protein
VRLETICISSSSEVDLKILGSFFGFDSTNIMFQGIEQPSWCSIALREDTATEFENQGVLAKKFKQCLFVDETNDDTFIIVLGAHMKILRGHGVGQSVPYCKILVQEPDHTLEDVHIREFDEQMYPDEDLERLREQDGLEKLTEGLQSATLELTCGRTAVVTVKRKELLDREEYCFKLTIKEKT